MSGILGEEMGNAYNAQNCVQKEEYKRPKQDVLKDYRITIEFLSVGCIIHIGCRSIPFTSVNQAMEELNMYIKNPEESIKRWNQIFTKEEN
jgi:hypothetical protein